MEYKLKYLHYPLDQPIMSSTLARLVQLYFLTQFLLFSTCSLFSKDKSLLAVLGIWQTYLGLLQASPSAWNIPLLVNHVVNILRSFKYLLNCHLHNELYLTVILKIESALTRHSQSLYHVLIFHFSIAFIPLNILYNLPFCIYFYFLSPPGDSKSVKAEIFCFIHYLPSA